MQTESTRSVVLAHWEAANARDWPRFAALLHDDMQYAVPQTRETIDSGAGYLDLFETWPGAWVATVADLVCEGSKAVCTIRFDDGVEALTGIAVFVVEGGRIVSVTDYWPAPYDPPPRHTAHLRRQPVAGAVVSPAS